MPPTSRSQDDRSKKAKRKGKKHHRPRANDSRTLRNSQSRGTRSNANTIGLSTVSRKAEKLKIHYREMIDFENMGGDAGSTPALIRINLNNPVIGGPVPPPNEGICTLIHSLKAGSTDALARHHSYQNDRNLSQRLEDYFTKYRSCIVTSSNVTVVVAPKPNQLNGMTGTNRSLVPYVSNRAITNPVAGQPDHYLYSQNANAMGQVQVWGVRQSDTNQLVDPVIGTYPLETLKQAVPGMRMTRLNVTANSSKGVTYKMKYTPTSQYQFKDILDNKKLLEIFDSPVGNTDQKEAYFYVGIGGRHNGADPSASQQLMGLPHFTVEVKVTYNLLFTERFNKVGNNEPSPHDVHAEDL